MEKTKDPAKKKTSKKASELPEESEKGGVLETVAKAIGSTIGEVAVKTGIAGAPKPPKKKLVSKGKHRLPRKLKKRLKKESQKSAAK